MPDVALTLKSPSLSEHSHTMSVPDTATIRTVKERIHDTWDGRPRVDGIRCIAAGRVLSDNEPVTAVTGILHIVVRPDALEAPAPTPAPAQPASTDAPPAPADAPPARPAPIVPNNPLLAYVEGLSQPELDLFIVALAATYEGYAAYARKLGRRAAPLPIAPAQLASVLASREAAAQAVRVIETDVMHWSPLEHESAAAQRRVHKACFKYTEVEFGGLPYLLREPAADPAVVAALGDLVDARLAFLARATVAAQRLYDMHAVEADARAAPPPPHALQPVIDNAGTIATGLLRPVFYALLIAWAITMHLPWRESLFVYGVLTLAIAVEGYFVVRRAVAQPTRPPARRAPSAARSTMQAPLDIPRLPRLSRRLQQSAPLYWAHTLARYDLERQEAEIGFEHVDSDGQVLAVDWATRDWTAEEDTVRPRPQALHERALLPLAVLVISLVPRLEEWRTDAIALRDDAIVALARRWEELQASGIPHNGVPPRILRHPYSLRVIAARRQAET